MYFDNKNIEYIGIFFFQMKVTSFSKRYKNVTCQYLESEYVSMKFVKIDLSVVYSNSNVGQFKQKVK
jgi:hypothetical protein